MATATYCFIVHNSCVDTYALWERVFLPASAPIRLAGFSAGGRFAIALIGSR